jgi:hypothetical protein
VALLWWFCLYFSLASNDDKNSTHVHLRQETVPMYGYSDKTWSYHFVDGTSSYTVALSLNRTSPTTLLPGQVHSRFNESNSTAILSYSSADTFTYNNQLQQPRCGSAKTGRCNNQWPCKTHPNAVIHRDGITNSPG